MAAHDDHGGSGNRAARAVEDYLADLLDEDGLETDDPGDAAPQDGDGVAEADAPSAEPVPHWRDREAPFRVQLVVVAGLQLAVPMQEIVDQQVLSTDRLKTDPDALPAGLGTLGSGAETLRVLDFATLILPPEQRQRRAASAAPETLLVLAARRWGLACHGLSERVEVAPDQVQWRDGQGQRPWLAGMLPMHQAALVDPQALVAGAVLEQP